MFVFKDRADLTIFYRGKGDYEDRETKDSRERSRHGNDLNVHRHMNG